MELEYHRGGIYLPALELWLDPHEPQPGAARVFVSHAHSDHMGDHREVILSAATSRLFRARLPGDRKEHVLPWGEPRAFEARSGKWDITLWPAGHVLGSAMAEVRAGGRRLVYTGDFKLRRGLSSEACDPERLRGADVLIMETTFGRPEYQFPPTREVMLGVIRFCREAIDNDELPVLLGYSLGKSQELLRGLAEAQLRVYLHEQVHRMTLIYQELGQDFPAFEKLSGPPEPGSVLVCPPMGALPRWLGNRSKLRKAVLTGWAMDPGCRFRYQVDAAFPLSDHADFPDLLRFVELIQPRRIYTVHGFAVEFAETLRGRGYDAWALGQSEQLFLGLSSEAKRGGCALDEDSDAGQGGALAVAPVDSGGGEETGVAKEEGGGSVADASSFLRFAQVCEAVGAVRGKLEKVRRLAEYLRMLEGVLLERVTVWFTGLPFAPSAQRALQLGWAVIRDATCRVSGVSVGEFHRTYLTHSDLGATVAEVWSRRRTGTGSLSLGEVAELFERLAAARGPTGKVPLLSEAICRCGAVEVRYLTKILTGDLRIGLKEGLVEEAVAQAFEVDVNAVRRANLLVGDSGAVARFAKENRLEQVGLVPFRAVKCMLASPESSAAAIWERMMAEDLVERSAGDGEAGLWVEDKLDGIRCQLHKVGDRVALYSRDLKEITGTFYEIADAARKILGDVILDGEVVAMRGDRVLPFADLQKRLGRRESDLFMDQDIPVRYAAFDILWRDGETLLDQPLHRRRERLEQLQALPPGMWVVAVNGVTSVQGVDTAFDAARMRGHEGLMIKSPTSAYTPGRRGLAWLKLKKALATLDCVVVGAEYGHGKRRDVLSDYTFAVRDDAGGELRTIGKAYSGLTDAEIAQLTKHFLARVRWRRGRYHEVEPDIVLEIAFDSIRPSQRHSSGLALRFPRIVRIRTDKTPTEIDTLNTARRLVDAGQTGKDGESSQLP